MSLLGATPPAAPPRARAGAARGGGARPQPSAPHVPPHHRAAAQRLLSTDDPTRDAPAADEGAGDGSARDATTNPQTQRPTQAGGREHACDRRIFGIENEYGITCTSEGQRRLSPDEVARYLFRQVVSWGRSSNVFLANGSRLYLDVGSHPEYATAECDSLRQLVAHDKAGERIIEGLVVDAQKRLREEGIAGDIYVFKNNTDSAGNSYGCHENYLVGRARRVPTSPTCCSRSSSAGRSPAAPARSCHLQGRHVCVSQRADHIWEGVSSATTRSRPIINTRDEPHADAEHYRRLHVIVGDSNMSETTTCSRSARRPRAADDRGGVVMRDLTLENPIRAIREI